MSVKIVHFFLSYAQFVNCHLKKKIFEWFSLVFVKKWETLQRLHLLPWLTPGCPGHGPESRSFTSYIILHLFTTHNLFEIFSIFLVCTPVQKFSYRLFHLWLDLNNWYVSLSDLISVHTDRASWNHEIYLFFPFYLY